MSVSDKKTPSLAEQIEWARGMYKDHVVTRVASGDPEGPGTWMLEAILDSLESAQRSSTNATGESETYRAVADAFIELADAAQRAFAAVGLETGEWDGDNITKDVERGLVQAINDLAKRSASGEMVSAVQAVRDKVQRWHPNAQWSTRQILELLDSIPTAPRTESAPICGCGNPTTLGVVHRAGKPCFHYQEPSALAEAAPINPALRTIDQKYQVAVPREDMKRWVALLHARAIKESGFKDYVEHEMRGMLEAQNA